MVEIRTTFFDDPFMKLGSHGFQQDERGTTAVVAGQDTTPIIYEWSWDKADWVWVPF